MCDIFHELPIQVYTSELIQFLLRESITLRSARHSNQPDRIMRFSPGGTRFKNYATYKWTLPQSARSPLRVYLRWFLLRSRVIINFPAVCNQCCWGSHGAPSSTESLGLEQRRSCRPGWVPLHWQWVMVHWASSELVHAILANWKWVSWWCVGILKSWIWAELCTESSDG